MPASVFSALLSCFARFALSVNGVYVYILTKKD